MGAMGITWGVGMGIVLPAAHGCGATVFECSSSADCTDDRMDGTCQPDGWCSFADPACASGQRYGDRAPASIAGECVDPLGDTTTGIGGTDASAEGVTSNATITSATGASAEATAGPTTGVTTTTTEADTGTTETGGDPVCGDGFIEGDEECDHGTKGAVGDCTADCKLNTCGDGMVGGREECDSTPGCSDACTLPTCGNESLDPNEECDGNDFGGLDCSSFGLGAGALQCSDCEITTAGCKDCPMGCQPSCTGARDCRMGLACVVPARALIGLCWPTCRDDSDCAQVAMGAACFFVEPQPACLVPCDVNKACPEGLECQALGNMGNRNLACL